MHSHLKGNPETRGTVQMCIRLTREADAHLRRLAGHKQALGRTIGELVMAEVSRREERGKIQAELVQTDGSTDSRRI